MKRILYILAILTLNLSGYGQTEFYCGRVESKIDSMERAWYPFQVVDSVRFQENNNFIIANINNKPIDFVSSEEKSYRRLSLEEPSSESYFNVFERDEYKDYQTYLIDFRKRLQYYDSLAWDEKKIANSMDMVVWIQNQTKDTILFPKQDGSLISIIEAKDKRGNWKPVQYWWYSWCGNSYSEIVLPPDNSIQIGLNNHMGEIPTVMRLKIHGRDTIYFSNEFPGMVSSDSFILNNKTKHEMIKDKYRISFLDSVNYDLSKFDDEIEITEVEDDDE